MNESEFVTSLGFDETALRGPSSSHSPGVLFYFKTSFLLTGKLLIESNHALV